MDLPVDIGHTGFDLLDEHSPEGAVVQPMPPGAHEVGVDHSTVVLGVLDQQTSTALAADHGALEEVVVQALALTVAVGVEHRLDLVPGLGIDQSRVLAGILHTLELHDSSVVGMTQQSVQSVLGDGLGRLAWGGWQVESQSGQVFGQLSHSPVTGSVLAEGQAHERCSLLIELDSADLPALGVSTSDVAVAQWRLAQSSAVPGFLTHPLDDLVGQVAGVELGDGAHDAVQ